MIRVAFVALLVMGGCDYGSHGAPPPAPQAGSGAGDERALRPRPGEAPSDEVAALVGPLGPGTQVAGWTITGVTGGRSRSIAIGVSRGTTSMTVWIEPKQTPAAHPSPRESDKYAITYEGQPGGTIPDGLDPLLDELVARLKRNER